MSEVVTFLTELLEKYLGTSWWWPLTAIVAGSVCCASLFIHRPKPFQLTIDINKQSIDIGGGVRISPLMVELKNGEPMKYLYEEAKTLYENFLRGLERARNEKCLGKKTEKGYDWITYQQVHDRTKAFGSGLLYLGLQPIPDTLLGIYSQNRIEWVLTEQACNMYSFVSVALYDTLGNAACQYIINLTQLSTLVCDKAEKAQSLLDKAHEMPSLKTIIIMDTISAGNLATAEKQNIQVVSFEDVEKIGMSSIQPPVPPQPSDLSTISFTSGTTGDPKGVMLTHENIISTFSAFYYVAKEVHEMTIKDAYLSYLPMAHMFERLLQVTVFSAGGHIGFSSGDVKLLLEDLRMLRPTVFATVPRLLNRIRDKVHNTASTSKIKKYMLNLALRKKLKLVKRGIVTNSTIWDTLVFRKIQKLMGGRVNLLVTGSAPISEETMNFIKCSMGCFVVEGYGQTEMTAAVTGQFPGDPVGGLLELWAGFVNIDNKNKVVDVLATICHVGGPIVCNYIKLVDVPEMDIRAADGKGEICAKGTNMFLGYYKNPEKTMETVDKDGWCHTGDVGMWMPNGALKLIDRKKHIFKLSQGEYVAPEKIELVYVKSKYIAQIFVDGNSFKTCCMAIVVPDQEVMDMWAPNNGFPTDMQKLCEIKKVKDIILSDLHDLGEKAGLKGFEQVLDITLIPEPFTVENNLLTPTFKSKRPELRKKYNQTIEDLYKDHDM